VRLSATRLIGKTMVLMVCVFAAIFTARPVRAQPGNDTCGANQASYTLLSIGGVVAGSLINATRDGSACQGLTGVDVYYYFTPSLPGPWRISLCTGSLPFDSVLSIHTNSCPVSFMNYATGMAPTSCNDDAGCSGPLSQIDSVPLTAGTPYIIRVARFANNVDATFTLTVVNLASQGACCRVNGTCTIQSVSLCTTPSIFLSAGATCAPNLCPQPPSNDLCDNAFIFSGTGFDTLGTTVLSTNDGTATCGNGGSRDVWYQFTPSATAAYSVTLCSSSAMWDSLLSVHTGCTGSSGNQLNGACNDDGCSGLVGLSAIPSLTLVAGLPYTIRVAGFGTSGVNIGLFRIIVGGVLGKCCVPTSGACSVITQSACASPNIWTSGGVCSTSGCDALRGACCDAMNGTCTLNFPVDCAQGKIFLGSGTTCTPNPCVQPLGACCLADGTCSSTLIGDCTGTFKSVGTICDPNPCPQPLGACCGLDGSCTITLDSACSGIFQTIGSICFPNPCPQPVGACCAADGACEITLPNTCPGAFVSVGSVCTPDPCPQPTGACCWPNGLCSIAIETTCAGLFLTVGSICGPNPCPQPTGACCDADVSCTITASATCSGTFQSIGSSCDPNPCPQPTGACCKGSSCSITTSAACSGPSTLFAGIGLACNTLPNYTAPCCLADYNHLAGLSIQDLFDFLAGYFGGDSAADINQSGVVSVQDIFNFLDAYFTAGCP